jgi:hypothetical protein
VEVWNWLNVYPCFVSIKEEREESNKVSFVTYKHLVFSESSSDS